MTQRDVTLSVNPNEVLSTRYVTPDELRGLLERGEKGEIKVTPWFRLICNNFLFKWWDNLSSLGDMKDTATIHNMLE